jgi:hypothetical protein
MGHVHYPDIFRPPEYNEEHRIKNLLESDRYSYCAGHSAEHSFRADETYSAQKIVPILLLNDNEPKYFKGLN